MSALTPKERRLIATLQLRSLAALGWGIERCAERCGLSKSAVAAIRAGRTLTISPRSAGAVAKMYAQWRVVRSLHPEADTVREIARRQGWSASREVLESISRTLGL